MNSHLFSSGRHDRLARVPCPRAGSGVHRWLLGQANRCRNAGIHAEQALEILREGSRNCGRFVPGSEMIGAIRTAYSTAPWAPNASGSSIQSRSSWWHKPDRAAIEAISANGISLAEFENRSPERFPADGCIAELAVDALFPGDPLLCVAYRRPSDASTAPRSTWRGRLAKASLIVPSPMSAKTGRTKEGKVSARCLDNVGPRRFLVVEFDNGDLDLQAARLWHLAQTAPLTIAVHSGNKSIHGWFFCQGIPDERLRNFMHRCVLLGADPATWTRCQMVRMPGGVRDNGRSQSVLFFNPKTLQPCHI